MDGKINNRLIIAFALLVGTFGITVAQNADLPKFVTSDKCIACHSDMVDEKGNTHSIGKSWKATMMALSAKDPYWQAAVKREIQDRPHLQKDIEDICSVCHMPMFRTMAKSRGKSGEILRYFEGRFTQAEQYIAEDGVSCAVCHQISRENLGKHSSFDGGYVITSTPHNIAKIYGPYEINAGLQKVMHSATGMIPEKSNHIQKSELCATCHTLFTNAIDGNGKKIGEFAEQVPYLEWKNSIYYNSTSCQTCHMPEIPNKAQISSVLGEMRENVSQHKFRGGNVFMLKIFAKYRDELNISTPLSDLNSSINTTLENLQKNTAELEIISYEKENDLATVKIRIKNKAGHKFPTAYPSRRAWLHFIMKDENGNIIFESGALNPDGSIKGNDNDKNPNSFEPHFDVISSEDQVQIYEPIIFDYNKTVTTSLLSAVEYAKDNRLLPIGFNKTKAEKAIKAVGNVETDENFTGGEDILAYKIKLPDQVKSVEVSVQLLYQTIGFRWAENLKGYDNYESNRFVSYYKDNADISTVIVSELKQSY